MAQAEGIALQSFGGRSTSGERVDDPLSAAESGIDTNEQRPKLYNWQMWAARMNGTAKDRPRDAVQRLLEAHHSFASTAPPRYIPRLLNDYKFYGSQMVVGDSLPDGTSSICNINVLAAHWTLTEAPTALGAPVESAPMHTQIGKSSALASIIVLCTHIQIRGPTQDEGLSKRHFLSMGLPTRS